MSRKDSQKRMLDKVRNIFEQKIPFNKVLGLRIASLEIDRARIELDMRDDLVGNYFKGSLHGGVVSAVLDVTGGVVAFLGLIAAMHGKTTKETMDRFSKMGTIDLRVDYLRPGLGKHFLCTGYILRFGNRVAVTRMELHDDRDRLIAVGTGAYFVG